MLDLSARTPYRIVDDGGRGQDRLRRGQGARAPRPSRRCVPRRSRGGRCRRLAVEPAPPGPITILPAPGPGALSMPALPEPQITVDGSGPRPRHGGEEVHGPPDQPGLQGRRPPGHLPPLRGHQRAERGREPRGERQGHPEADRGALGPGPRPDPEDQRPRLHPRGQRHPHRPAGRPRSTKSRDGGSWRRRRRSRATSPTTRSASPTPRRPSISTVLKKAGALSARGQINVDARTNTMIITRPARPTSRRRKDLIAELDRATPQVEIEARIVVTSRNFTRDLGIQWGFLNQQTPQLRQHHRPGLPELHRSSTARACPSTSGIPADQGGQASGRRHRRRGPRLRGQPARRRLQHRPSGSRSATSSAASTSTRPSPPSSGRAAAACSRRPR